MKYKTTKDVSVPKKTVERIIGQKKAVSIVKKAARQGRHVMLIGLPGTGKSMIGLALSELLPTKKLKDVLVFPNKRDENQPKVRTVSSGKGRTIMETAKLRSLSSMRSNKILFFVLAIIALILPWWIRSNYGDIMAAASLIAGMMFVAVISLSLGFAIRKKKKVEPKLLVDTFGKKRAPFVEATSAKAGALFGDIKHDPFQSGGLGTPAHLRVEPGMIHKANKGVLFIDEVATLDLKTQQELLTALQEGKAAITGKSERSAGAMVRTEPVPCEFILVAAGNQETVKNMHPALRSRIRGYGYEVYMSDVIDDNRQNRDLFIRFVAQEVKKDGKIPHFTKPAVQHILKEARKRAGRKGKLTLKLRDLGGLIRAAGDVALEAGDNFVKPKHIQTAKKISKTLEHQVADRYIERKKEYEVIRNKGKEVGRVNGLATLGDRDHFSGIVQPIDVEVTQKGDSKEHTFLATGKLGEIAKEAITNVSAIVRKKYGEDMNKNDVYVQFLQTYSGLEGDSASVAVAAAVISALKQKPIRQDTAMTGSLSVRGEVLPVGGVSAKMEAAVEAGIKRVLIPKSNLRDVVISKSDLKKIKIISVSNIDDVLKNVF